jgi:hypothetical protein
VTKAVKRQKAITTPESISDLTPDPRNARKHSERNISVIAGALSEVGAARSIVIDEDGVILAGNATIQAAQRAGITRVKVVEADGAEVVAVRRTGLTAAQKAKLALYDNRAAELADGWDIGVLQALQAEGVDLSGMWDKDELSALLEPDRGPVAGQTDPDDVPAERATDIQAGDLFELGVHRLLCGDSTKSADVSRLLGSDRPFLMVTDPPYGVKYDPAWRKNRGLNNSDRMGTVANDDNADWTPAWELFPGDVAYVWTSLIASDFEVRAEIVWRKPSLVISRGHYHAQHESAFYVVRSGKTSKWGGDHSQSTVWDIARKDDTGQTTHGTQKPIECMRRPIANHGGPDDHVYEPFSGSGSTLIACEQLGRRCFANELNPSYVQQAIDRWEAFTGQKAVKVGELARV